MMSRWRGEPHWLRGVVVALAVLLLYGTAVHVVQIVVAGGQPYPGLPWWLRIYFISLTVPDPLSAVLLLRRCRPGVLLAVAVLVTDAVANGLANYAFDQTAGLTAGRLGQAFITLIAVGEPRRHSLVVAGNVEQEAASLITQRQGACRRGSSSGRRH